MERIYHNWVLVDEVSIDSTGAAAFTNNTGEPYRFYKLENGQCHSRVIGMVRLLAGPGWSVLANQLDTVKAGSQPPNSLNALFNSMPDGTSLPDGSQIYEMDSSGTYHTYTWSGGSWGSYGGVTLSPGGGAWVNNVSSNSVIITFAGLVREGNLTNPIVSGGRLYSSMIPQAGRVASNLGYVPQYGDAVELYNVTTAQWDYYSYSNKSHTWSPSEPVVNVGEPTFIVPKTTNSWQINYSACPACFSCP